MRPDQYDDDQENKMIKGLFLRKFVPKIISYFAVGKKNLLGFHYRAVRKGTS